MCDVLWSMNITSQKGQDIRALALCRVILLALYLRSQGVYTFIFSS